MSAGAALHAAIAAGDADRVREVLAADPAVAAARDAEGISALARAAYLGRGDLLELVLAANPPLDVFDAAIAGSDDRLAALLADDPSPATAWSADGFTALHLAGFFGHPIAVGLLLAAGADPAAASHNAMRVAPLHSAAARLDPEAVLLLLEAGADVDARQQGGITALMAAAHAGHAGLLELLLAAGADPALRDDEGHSAADHARASGHAELAVRL